MKKIFLILAFGIFTVTSLMAQETNDNSEKIRDRMKEFIQKRMRLSANEADQFTPVFYRYYNEWRSALKENRADPLFRQQKIIELRLRYRSNFKEIMGEPRSNEVFRQQDLFIRELDALRKDRIQHRNDQVRKRFR